jgi:hypothetical protein
MIQFRKCQCIKVDYGSYDNEVVLKVPLDLGLYYNDPEKTPRLTVSVDKCISKEIQGLWALGIRTTGCCCNHNKDVNYPFIEVVEEDMEKMILFGYKKYPNKENMFFPKTLLISYA